MGAGQHRPSGAPETGPRTAVPPEVDQAARAAFAALDRDALLADLVHDSLDDALDDADDAGRTVTFEGGGLAVELHVGTTLLVVVDPAPETASLETLGQDAPPLQPAGEGRWTATPVPTGPVSVLAAVDGRRVRTAWTRL